jgi:hypothetical protein
LTCVVLAAAATGTAAGSPPNPSASFFHMSPIKASGVPGAAVLRLSVTLAHVRAGDAPAITWRLTLGKPAGGAPSAPPPVCANGQLPGGEHVTPNDIIWRNQGLSFLWYGGSAPCRATVAVLAENESEQCSASLAIPASAAAAGSGSRAVCKLGGYTFGSSVLPVPAAVLHGYATAPAELARLVGELRRGTLAKAAFEQLIAPLLRSQKTSFSTLFPPVFGCSFASLFQPVVAAQRSLNDQVAQTPRAGTARGPAVSAASADLQVAAQRAAACRASAANTAGASPTVVATLDGLAAQAKGLSGRGMTPAALKAGLAALAARLDTTLRHGFPPVFGIAYADLVSRVAAVDSAISRAGQSALAGDDKGAAAALAGAIAPDRAIHQGLVRHQRHVIAVEFATT